MQEAILQEAESWLRTPFHHRAMIKGVGVDCAHFILAVYTKAAGIEPFEVEQYPPDWHFHRSEERFIATIEKYFAKVEIPLPGDVAMWKFGRCFSHGSIVIEWPRIIHAYVGMGVVHARATDAELAGREITFWRLRRWVD